MYIIAIDSGTTNLRTRLVSEKGYKVIDIIKSRVGVKDTIAKGNSEILKERVSKDLEQILKVNNLDKRQIKYIVASGMITSNIGIYEVPHIAGPATLDDFANGSVIKVKSEFLNIPCLLIPGMKNSVIEDSKKAESINAYDVMRGEEVESYGLIKQLNLKGSGIIVLPGSHTKYVYVDDDKIVSSLSTLCGEMIHSISKNTILSSSFNQNLIDIIDKKALLKGFESGKEFGLSRSFYHIRLLQIFEKMDENERANYFVGSILASDIESFMQSDLPKTGWVVIGGSDPLRKAFVHVFEYLEFDNIIEASDTRVESSTVVGSIEIAEAYFNSRINT